jgi:putative endonuclease
MWVYVIESRNWTGRRYVGLTASPRIRIGQHNAGEVKHTARYRPWALVAAIWLADRTAAREFEAYLKSGSGSSFARRHFLAPPT